MKRMLRVSSPILLVLALLNCAPDSAFAQSYPARPVHIVVPFPPGGSTDVVARLIAQKLTDSLGQTVVVENRAGGNAIIGTEYSAKAAADGYTLLMAGVQNLAIVPSLFKNLPYDPVRDFTPVAYIGYSPFFLLVPPGSPVRSVRDLIALAKSKPGKLNCSSSATGGSSHLTLELFKIMTGTDIVHVPYKGTGPALIDLMGGHNDLHFDSTVSSMAHVQGGKLRALGVTSLARLPSAPDVPTLDESGLRGFQSDSWLGFVAPAGTPKEIVARLNAETNNILKRPDIKAQMDSLGLEMEPGTAEQYGAKIKAEIAIWSKVVKQANVKVD